LQKKSIFCHFFLCFCFNLLTLIFLHCIFEKKKFELAFLKLVFIKLIDHLRRWYSSDFSSENETHYVLFVE